MLKDKEFYVVIEKDENGYYAKYRSSKSNYDEAIEKINELISASPHKQVKRQLILLRFGYFPLFRSKVLLALSILFFQEISSTDTDYDIDRILK